ncbi:hypothetical protein OSB04_027354 [Centaurea solstitialis]|uniref:Uncharacterized protein n=1 Tax=Centaurea solstitialis TaxID=347529 RepID=A0AA38SYN3_9ASTR|nr:hypothetical protein OSB04_027354 [Centaurea solstitialis]
MVLWVVTEVVLWTCGWVVAKGGMGGVNNYSIPFIRFQFDPQLIDEEWMVNHHLPSTLMKLVVISNFDLPVEIKPQNRSGYIKNLLYESIVFFDMASRHGIKTYCSQLDASPRQRCSSDGY